jgi:predicted DCC family thiol-disulfide oxidoreductase YuxK
MPSSTKVIYDDDCVLCNNFKVWIEQRSSKGAVSFIGSSQVQTDEPAFSLVLLGDEGIHLYGVSAVLETVGKTNGPLGSVARAVNHRWVHLLLTPLYQLIARNRKALSRLLQRSSHV